MDALWSHWWSIPLGIAAGLAVMWLVVIVALWRSRPDDIGLRDAVRLLPDLIRLIKRLAADSTLPRGCLLYTSPSPRDS